MAIWFWISHREVICAPVCRREALSVVLSGTPTTPVTSLLTSHEGNLKVARPLKFKGTLSNSSSRKSLIWYIKLKVIEKASKDTTAVYSEIMMYVLLVFLTFWLLVEMVYCYRKISKSDEQAEDTA
ncbi:Sodium channel subunit beta-3, partial [Larimichthys crocea]